MEYHRISGSEEISDNCVIFEIGLFSADRFLYKFKPRYGGGTETTMYPIIEFAGRQIGTYALCALMGLFVCGFIAARLWGKRELTVDDIIILILCIAAGMLVGGHALYGIINITHIYSALCELKGFDVKQVLRIFVYYLSGSIFYGGFIGGCCALMLYSKFTEKADRAVLFDMLAVCVPLFHFFGRIGCFFGGCCYGIESKYGFIVYNNELSPELNGVCRFPVQLLEALCNLLIFSVLLILHKKKIRNGCLIYIYLLLYPAVRFITEFLRGDEIRGIWFGLSTSQWISIVLFAFASEKLILSLKRARL